VRDARVRRLQRRDGVQPEAVDRVRGPGRCALRRHGSAVAVLADVELRRQDVGATRAVGRRRAQRRNDHELERRVRRPRQRQLTADGRELPVHDQPRRFVRLLHRQQRRFDARPGRDLARRQHQRDPPLDPRQREQPGDREVGAVIRRPAGAKERGAVLIVTTLLLTAVLGMTAILVDLGQVRSTTRLDQSVADLAALAAGKWLSQKNPAAACQDAVTYLNANANLSPTINAVNFCAQSGNDVNKTTCSSGSLTEAKPSATVGRYSVSIHYPVPDSEIADTNVSGGAHANDGVPCERMRVVISATDSRIFGGVLGGGSLATTRSATVRPSIAKSKLTPALWLLDPTGCTALSVSGGSQLTIGTTSPGIVQGVVTVDSDGSTCSSNQDTVSVSGAGTFLKAVPTTPPPSPDQDKVGTVELLALPIGATTCVDPACNSADVTAGRLSPQPVPEGERGTRGPVDWVYNCKSGYRAYH